MMLDALIVNLFCRFTSFTLSSSCLRQYCPACRCQKKRVQGMDTFFTEKGLQAIFCAFVKKSVCECEAWILRPKSAKSADIKKRPPKNEDEDGAEEKEPGVEEDSDSEDENAGGDLDDDQLMPFTQSFIFSLLWALGGYLEDSERGKLEAFLRGTVSKSN